MASEVCTWHCLWADASFLPIWLTPNPEVPRREHHIHMRSCNCNVAIVSLSSLIYVGAESNLHQLLRKSCQETRDSEKEVKMSCSPSRIYNVQGFFLLGSNSSWVWAGGLWLRQNTPASSVGQTLKKNNRLHELGRKDLESTWLKEFTDFATVKLSISGILWILILTWTDTIQTWIAVGYQKIIGYDS